MVARSSVVQPVQQLEQQGLVSCLQPPCAGQRTRSVPTPSGEAGIFPGRAGPGGVLLGAAAGFSHPHGAAGCEGPALSGRGREEDGSWLALLLASGIYLAVASHEGPSRPRWKTLGRQGVPHRAIPPRPARRAPGPSSPRPAACRGAACPGSTRLPTQRSGAELGCPSSLGAGAAPPLPPRPLSQRGGGVQESPSSSFRPAAVREHGDRAALPALPLPWHGLFQRGVQAETWSRVGAPAGPGAPSLPARGRRRCPIRLGTRSCAASFSQALSPPQGTLPCPQPAPGA